MARGKYVTPEEIEFVRENMGTMSRKEIGEYIERSESAVTHIISRFIKRTDRAKESVPESAEPIDIMLNDDTPRPKELTRAEKLKMMALLEPRDLMEELRRRGYDGDITYTETIVHKVRLSQV